MCENKRKIASVALNTQALKNDSIVSKCLCCKKNYQKTIWWKVKIAIC